MNGKPVVRTMDGGDEELPLTSIFPKEMNPFLLTVLCVFLASETGNQMFRTQLRAPCFERLSTAKLRIMLYFVD